VDKVHLAKLIHASNDDVYEIENIDNYIALVRALEELINEQDKTP
jgi:hypothetical protein